MPLANCVNSAHSSTRPPVAPLLLSKFQQTPRARPRLCSQRVAHNTNERVLDESFSPSMLLRSLSPPPALQSCRGSFRGCEMVDALATLPAALSINI